MSAIRHRFGTGVVLLLIAASSPTAFAQISTGKIVGVVQDSSGAVLPGASIAVRNVDTGGTREALSNDRGQYEVPGLQPGRYQVDVELQGFRRVSQGPVIVQVNQETRLNATLAVGAIEETVTVQAAGSLVQTTTSVVGKVVDEKQILELPLSGRNFADLGLLTPGVTTRGQTTSAGTSFYVHGQRDDANNFLLDGTSDNSLEGNTLQARPNVDAVQEFKIQTSNFSAEFGRNAGSVVNVVTKSGTNDLRASGWEFNRSDKFQARNFFATTDPPPLRFNQFGATAGGPFALPGLYSGRNRTFFFGSYEGYRERRGLTQQTIVATEQERNGDFSFLSRPIVDPATGQAFAGNRIPLDRISPAARKLLALMPLPNIAGVAPRRNNFVSSPANENKYDQYMGRLDHTFNQHWTMFYRHFVQQNDVFNAFQGASPARYPGFANVNPSRVQHATGGANTVFRPTLLNEFRAGFSRTAGRSSNLPFLNPLDYGINYVRPQDAIGGLGLPDITINGISGIGNSIQGPSVTAINEFEVSDVMSAIRGRHNLRFGGTWRPGREDIDNGFFVIGRFVFNGTYTGDSFADFLLGRASEFDYGKGRTRMLMINQNFGAFVQDDFKVRDNLTLNLGVRYDYYSPIIDDLGQTSTFIVNREPTGAPQSGTAEVILAGTHGLPDKGTYFPDRNNLQPRAGFSWDVNGTGRFAVRGGAGVFTNQLRNNLTLQQILSYPFYEQPVVRDTLLDNPIKPVSTPLVGQLYVTDPDIVTPYAVAYNVNTQWEFVRNTILEVAYIGNRGYQLLQFREMNQPVYVPGQTTAANKDLFRPFPGFTSVLRSTGWGSSNYNGLETSVQRRFSDGLSYQISWVFARSNDYSSRFHSGATNRTYIMMAQDDNDRNADYAASDFDVRHRIVASQIYQLPFGAGQRWGGSGLLAPVVGGWSVASIWTFQTGFPYTIYDGSDPCLRAGNWTPSCRPNAVADPNQGPKTPQEWFDTRAFQKAAPGASGTAPRNAIRGPALVNTDLSLIRTIVLGKTSMDVRVECFNLFNRVNLGVPVTDFSSSSFGRIQSTATPAREFQFGVKFRF